MTKVRYRDSKGRFASKGKAVKPKVVKGKVVKPKVIKKPTKRVYYKDSKGRFCSKEKYAEVQVLKIAEKIKAKKEARRTAYTQSKFGRIAKREQLAWNISEKKAIRRTRKLLKIPKSDYNQLSKKDVQILQDETP